MLKLKNYLLSNNNTNINWEDYNYNNYSDYYKDFKFLCEYYDIKVMEEKEKRLSQNEFRIELINKYKSCIVTDNPSVECEAAHINPVKNDGDYFINNGLLLNCCIHKTFDLYYWSINPDTHIIEVNEKYNTTINKYKDKQLNLDPSLYNNLLLHYTEYKKLI